MKNKKGFTLVEIIVCIVLIALIGTVFTVSFFKNDNSENQLEKEKQELEVAGEIYIENAISKNNYKFYETNSTNEKGEQITEQISCLSPENLIKNGILTEDNSYYKKLVKDNLYLKVTKNSIGNIKYEEVSKNDSSCYTYNDETKFQNSGTIETVGKLDEDGYEFTQSIIQGEGNNYKYNLDYKLQLKSIENITINIPLYVVIVLDESSSMRGIKWNNAIQAVETLTKKIIGIGSKNEVALIKFGLEATKARGFAHLAISAKDIEFANSSSTCYSCGLKKAYDLLNDNKYKIVDGNNFFVVFLSDGMDNHNTNKREKYVYNIKNLIINHGEFITIGYETSNTILENMATDGCGGRCYYKSDTSGVINLFNNLASTISQKAVCSQFKKAKITIELSDNFKKINDIEHPNQIISEIAMKCDETNLEIKMPELGNLNEDIIYTPTKTCSEEKCEITENIVKNVKIDFYDDKNVIRKTIPLDVSKFPSITLILTKQSVVN